MKATVLAQRSGFLCVLSRPLHSWAVYRYKSGMCHSLICIFDLYSMFYLKSYILTAVITDLLKLSIKSTYINLCSVVILCQLGAVGSGWNYWTRRTCVHCLITSSPRWRRPYRIHKWTPPRNRSGIIFFWCSGSIIKTSIFQRWSIQRTPKWTCPQFWKLETSTVHSDGNKLLCLTLSMPVRGIINISR